MKLCVVELLLTQFIQHTMTPFFQLHKSLVSDCSIRNNIYGDTSLYPAYSERGASYSVEFHGIC